MKIKTEMEITFKGEEIVPFMLLFGQMTYRETEKVLGEKLHKVAQDVFEEFLHNPETDAQYKKAKRGD